MAIALSVAGIAACGSSKETSPNSKSSEQAAESNSGATKNCTTTILLVTNITGEGSANGSDNVAGAKVAEKQVNEEGGVLGCKLAVETRDDESNYTTDLPLIQKALSEKEYPMIMNSDFGSSSTTPYLTREKILSISATGTAGLGNPAVNPYFFEVVPLNTGAVNVGAEFAIKQGHKKIALIVDNTAVGTEDIKDVKPIIAKGGGTLTDAEQVSFSAVNLTPAVLKAKASGAEALVVDLFGPAAGHLMSDIKSSGWNVPTYGGQEIFQTNLASFVPVSDLTNLTAIGSAVGAEPTTKGGEELIEGLTAEGVKITGSLAGYAQVHDDLVIFAAGVNGAKSTESAAVAKYLETHGTTPVPHLSQAEVTGYTPQSHEWEPPNALAIAKGGAYKNGLLKRIELANIPK